MYQIKILIKYTSIFFNFFSNNLSFAQSSKGIYELVKESDFIIIGTLNKIDTLERNKSQNFQSNTSIVEISEIIKGAIYSKEIPLHFYTKGGSHFYEANPVLDENHLFFLKLDSEKQQYILPSNKYSIVKISETNEAIVVKIIEDILDNKILNCCEFFDLVITNIEEPIIPVRQTLIDFAMEYDSIQNRFCVDSNDLKYLYDVFERTKALEILPFISNYNIEKVEEILLDEIKTRLKSIPKSDDFYRFEEKIEIVNLLSYLINNLDSTKYYNMIDEEFAIFSRNNIINIDNKIDLLY